MIVEAEQEAIEAAAPLPSVVVQRVNPYPALRQVYLKPRVAAYTRDKICTSVANRVIPGALPALNLQSCTIQQCRDVSSATCARLDQVKQDLPGVVNRLCAHDSENPQCTRAHAKTLRQLVRSMSSCCQESQVHTSLKQRIKKRDPWVNFKEEDCPQSRHKW